MSSIDKSKMKNSVGNYITQQLFVDFGYDETAAQYTVTKEDRLYNGTFYPSLYRRYMEIADPTEYEFATQCLYDWEHWQRIVNNKMLSERLGIAEWREELEVKLRSAAVRNVLNQASENFSAAKWAADRGWDVRRGRPSKEEKARESSIKSKIEKSIADDSARIVSLVRK